MRRTPILTMTLALLAVPALAQGFSVQLANNTSQSVTSLSLFPLNKDGEVIEDNLGGFYEAVTSGGSVTVDIPAACGSMLAVVTLEDGSDLRASLDTCTETILQISD